MKKRILCICGSIREGSINQMLMNEVSSYIKDEVDLMGFRIDRSIPMLDPDSISTVDLRLIYNMKKSIKDADGIIISTPEYNGSIPGGLKNIIDWISYKLPNEEDAKYFYRKKVAIMSASTGVLRGVRAAMHLQDIMMHLKASICHETLSVQIVENVLPPHEIISRFAYALRDFFN
ncbi:NAD(P)H-dependent oxidoreductase [Candidatus Cyrtobacter comes]|uniref:NAD(P)H-dependent oxidoreductase n=1 Tax=Candidatus Cyrtobacter comes TaxID=675776 RepID=A0ABU5L6Y8_9RICK|nr:NAD(P)H-dependent oxidoreductase [Candidatus Cyrtobacter comes]MDZ5761892.1 NAD(P)H-dependent oxidoreductase [Candidatus Cyrtobacter comes]